MSWELVSGLETHVELSTETKIFCGCSTKFGAEPNTNCCPVCVGHPGTLPKLNRQVVRYAIMAGLATHCRINTISKMDRKNYVYPDLSKAYQISQFDEPLCVEGYVELESGKRIRLTRIHIEEDAGKLVHTRGKTLVDYNRGGVPLIEIVTEPDFSSVEEIREYLERLQQTMRYIGVSDCKMQEGSLRCDVNISSRKSGTEALGTRTEIKNMNSFTNIEKAVHYEFERQTDLLDSGETIIQETRRWNDDTGETESMRSKEDAHDYRYFPEPDLVTIRTTDEEIEAIRSALPELPDVKYHRYVQEYGIAPADASILVKYRRVAEFFEGSTTDVKNKKTAANLIITQIFAALETEEAKEQFVIQTTAAQFGELLALMDSGKLKMNLAKKALPEMLESGKPVTAFVSEDDMAGVDDSALETMCQAAIDQNAKAVADYLGGKEKALKSLVGAVMRESHGKADAGKAEALLITLLSGKATPKSELS